MTALKSRTVKGHTLRELQQARAVALSLAPEALGVLRLLRVENTEWPEAVRREAKGAPITGMLSHEWGGWVYPLARSVTSLGRGLQNDLVLLDPAVSRDHARLVLTREGWWVENLSEHNPLWVSDLYVPPRRHTRIFPGETLALGSTTLQLLAPDSPRHTSARGDAGQGSRALLGPDEPLAPLGVPDALDGLDETAATSEPARSRPTAEITVMELGNTNLFSPGVTLQFALSGKLGPRARWLAAGLALLIFVISGVLTLGIASLVGQNAMASDGVGRVLAALTIPLIPALGVTLLVVGLDRYEREPPLLLLAAFLWGAVIAIPPVLYIEGALNGALPALLAPLGTTLTSVLAPGLSAGVTEEAIKGAGLLALMWVLHDEFDNVTDGILYGALIGAGFGMVENFVYFAVTPRAALGVLIFGRVVLGWLGHSTFTALFGAGLGYARERHLRRRAWVAPVIGFAASMLLHTFFDTVAFAAQNASTGTPSRTTLLALGLATVLLDYAPLFAAQAILLRMVLAALEREAATVREYLGPELAAGIVTPDEYTQMQSASLRAGVERRYAWAYGLRVYLTARSLHQALIGLAFRKWHVAQGDPPKRSARQPEDAYRERVTRLRRSLHRQLRHHDRGLWRTPVGAAAK